IELFSELLDDVRSLDLWSEFRRLRCLDLWSFEWLAPDAVQVFRNFLPLSTDFAKPRRERPRHRLYRFARPARQDFVQFFSKFGRVFEDGAEEFVRHFIDSSEEAQRLAERVFEPVSERGQRFRANLCCWSEHVLDRRCDGSYPCPKHAQRKRDQLPAGAHHV